MWDKLCGRLRLGGGTDYLQARRSENGGHRSDKHSVQFGDVWIPLFELLPRQQIWGFPAFDALFVGQCPAIGDAFTVPALVFGGCADP